MGHSSKAKLKSSTNDGTGYQTDSIASFEKRPTHAISVATALADEDVEEGVEAEGELGFTDNVPGEADDEGELSVDASGNVDAGPKTTEDVPIDADNEPTPTYATDTCLGAGPDASPSMTKTLQPKTAILLSKTRQHPYSQAP
jgi:hypothetical protein